MIIERKTSPTVTFCDIDVGTFFLSDDDEHLYLKIDDRTQIFNSFCLDNPTVVEFKDNEKVKLFNCKIVEI